MKIVLDTNAVCIVTHDRDFRSLQTIAFPKVTVMDTQEFKQLLNI